MNSKGELVLIIGSNGRIGTAVMTRLRERHSADEPYSLVEFVARDSAT